MAAPPHEESDDFSLFLHQIMLRSSSSSAAPSLLDKKEIRPVNDPLGSLDCGVQVQRVMVSGSDRVPLPEASSGGGLQWSSGGVFASLGTCFGDRVVNVPSSSLSVGTGDNDLNEYDCESEGFEGAADGALLKPTAGRCSSSKRSRAAEVHNQSEKRRRSRINEKMKALQNLIPNSNKTDKASMLDEAIDYLKQLQLQVQMLTMRNGLSLYPMCVPGAVPPNQICEMKMMDEGNVSLASLLAPAPAPSNLLFTPPDNYIPHNHKQASVFNLPRLNDSESAHQSAFHFPLPPPPASSKKGIYMEGKLPCPQPDSFNARVSRVEEDSLEACVLGGDESGGLFLSNQVEFGKVEMSQGDNHRVEELH